MQNIIQKTKELLGENLVSLALYGKIDHQYLIVVDELNISILEKIRPLIKEWAKKVRGIPLILTHEELTDGSDVFPLEFLNIKLNHEILEGEDVFEKLSFDKKHIRRELEFEFRSKLINLRQGFLETSSEKDLDVIIAKAIPTLLPILNGLVFLKNKLIPDSIDEIFGLIEKEYNTSLRVLKDLEGNVKKEKREYINELIKLLSELGEILDEMKV